MAVRDIQALALFIGHRLTLLYSNAGSPNWLTAVVRVKTTPQPGRDDARLSTGVMV